MQIEFLEDALRICRKVLLEEWREHPEELLKIIEAMEIDKIQFIDWLITASAEKVHAECLERLKKQLRDSGFGTDISQEIQKLLK